MLAEDLAYIGTLDSLLIAINEELSKKLHRLKNKPEICNIVEYAIFPGGKRIRPLLYLSLCADFGMDLQKVLAVAAALEILHCSTLIHDDLPCIDNDDLRRGRPTCHKIFGEAQSLLAANYMVGLSFELSKECDLNDSDRLKILSILAEAYSNVCYGQILDIGTDSNVLRIHEYKTASLFIACAQCAGISSKLPVPALTRLRDLGYWIGVGFQLVDDYIDLFGTEQERGRPASSDLRNKKRTYFVQGKEQEAALVFSQAKDEINNCLNDLILMRCVKEDRFKNLEVLLATCFSKFLPNVKG